MKRRFGGLLSLALGIVLIAGGSLSGAGSGSVGALQCGITVVGVTNPCPAGTITVTEKTATAGANFAAPAAARAAATPTSWTVTISSPNCLATNGQPVDETLQVPTNGSKTSGDLYVYRDRGSTAVKCQYVLEQTPVAGYTATFAPMSPVTLPDPGANRDATGNLPVTLTDTALAVSSSASAPSSTPVSSASSSSSASTSESSSESPSSASTSAGGVDPVNTDTTSASGDVIASTGPQFPVGLSLLLGAALCLLGLVLLFAGRLPGSGRRT